MLSGAAKDVMEDTLPAYRPDAELTMMQVHSEMQAQDIRADRKLLNKVTNLNSRLFLFAQSPYRTPGRMALIS